MPSGSLSSPSHFCSPRDSIFALSRYLGSIVGMSKRQAALFHRGGTIGRWWNKRRSRATASSTHTKLIWLNFWSTERPRYYARPSSSLRIQPTIFWSPEEHNGIVQYPVVYPVDAVVFPYWKTEVINSTVPPVAKGMVALVSARSAGPSLRSSPQKSSPSKSAAKGQAGNDHKTAPRGAKGVVATESASAAGPSLKPSLQMSSPSKGVAKGQEGQGHRARAKANGQPEIVVGWWVFRFVRPAGLIEQMVNCPLG